MYIYRTHDISHTTGSSPEPQTKSNYSRPRATLTTYSTRTHVKPPSSVWSQTSTHSSFPLPSLPPIHTLVLAPPHLHPPPAPFNCKINNSNNKQRLATTTKKKDDENKKRKKGGSAASLVSPPLHPRI
ncbi:hypothetical protein K456DRAFT_860866 [Colletotrichum gloeosporioides 23]|nr:hypothetical protein K456DRAFT_860866 [Colletotrichum gloeosporioides 23]